MTCDFSVCRWTNRFRSADGSNRRWLPVRSSTGGDSLVRCRRSSHVGYSLSESLGVAWRGDGDDGDRRATAR